MRTTIREISLGVFDGPHATPPPSETGALYLGIGAIGKDGYIDEGKAKRIALEDLPKWTRRVTPRAGDIVFSYEATLNLYAIIPSGFRGCMGRRIGLIRPDTSKVSIKFLFYYFFSPQWRALIKSKTVQGATVDRLSIEDFPDFPVDLPVLETQERIVRMLEPYDALIENNRRQIKLLEEAAQRLYKEWFVDLRFPGYEHTPIVNGMPQGWRMMQLDQIADIECGQSPKSEYYNTLGEGLPFHQGVGSYGARFVKDDTYSSVYSKVAPAGSILFSVRAPVGRLNVTMNEVAIGRGLAAMNHVRNRQSFLFYMLKAHFFKEDLAGNGAIFASISKPELKKMKFRVPGEDLQELFEAEASRLDAKLAVLVKQNDLLTEARDRLLPKLMSGEIEAPALS